MTTNCTLILPCLNEGPALPKVLHAVPEGIDVIVVDNGSTDDTAVVAARHGARVVKETTPGYGAAVHAGVLAAETPMIAVMDGDGSMDPIDLLPLIDLVRSGAARLAVGRRRPAGRGVWPWHARLGNQLVVRVLHARVGLRVHDIAPVRVCGRQDLIDLGVIDRRFGYPVELLARAGAAGWAVVERDVAYHPRAAGTASKVSGSVLGSARAARDFAKVLS